MRKAVYEVWVAGQNITSRLLPLLTSLEIADHEGTHSDTARIVIDDALGNIRFPRTGDPISISLGWDGEGASVVFEGTIDEPRSSGSRGGGRELSISAKGVDTQGRAKEPQELHIDDADVETALKRAGEEAGITDIKVDPALASIRRPWWGLNDESFLHFGERVAREVGGIFKVKGNKAILVSKTGGTASGNEMPTIVAEWGVNLMAWDITPAIGRPRHRRARARWYDTEEARWREQEVEVDDDVPATTTNRYSRADEDEADSVSESDAKSVEREKGSGTVTIDGTASARPGGTCIVRGARAGVDGSYRIKVANHTYDRSGWITRLEVRRPHGDAGTDNR